jgi:diguanylate cyclase (GGDEF)-like protein
MSYTQNVSITEHLNSIIQLNPFDAVVVVSTQEQQFYVELVNTKATTLFNMNFEFRSPAHHFFAPTDWDKLKRCIEHANGGTHYILLENEKQIVTQIIPNVIEEKRFYFIVMRYIANEAGEAFETHLETAKHLYFIEQYVDPVISLDLTGTIVYVNVSAMKKLDVHEQLIGKNIYSLIEKDSIVNLKKVLNTTYEGFTSGGMKILLKNNLFNEEAVSVSTFPTYWDRKVIGAHLIIKNLDDLFENRSNMYPAYEDELTGLLNRRALNEEWSYYSSNFPDLNTALLLVDIDRFKRFNDSLGKQKADNMLSEISTRFIQLRNEFCEVFRYNGDEYVFIVKYSMTEEVEVIANKILHVLKEALIVEGQEYFVTASIGISTTASNTVAELESMLQQADQALFHVKVNGRAHYRFYRKEMSLSFPNEALMEAHLKRAIEFDELSVYFQPQLNLETNTIDSFEALMRWNNRKFGSVPPSQFIPLAESSGLIIQIGDWILERVFQYQHEWKQKGFRPVRIAINISPKQLKHEGFVDRVQNLIQKYDIEAQFIELEITEGSMMNVNETTEILVGLKELGVYVSVDDFGTGYSSLSYLTTYPIDIIKIDQSFISDMKKGKKNEALVKAIINLSQNLGIEVIAEGVEDRSQEQFLMDNNCKKVQGYLYDKPLPAEKVVEQYLA